MVPDEIHDPLAETQIVPPTVITTGQLSVDLGTRRVRVTYHGRGHTGSDVVDVGFVRSQRADIAVAIERSRRTDRRRAVAA